MKEADDQYARMMDCDWNEKLREWCALGDLVSVKQIVSSGKADVNSQNKVNGWTALHWASKRDHFPVIQYLVEDCQANPSIRNVKGDEPGYLCSDKNICDYFSSLAGDKNYFKSKDNSKCSDSTTFIPNYLAHPNFIYSQTEAMRQNLREDLYSKKISNFQQRDDVNKIGELVLKLRNASSREQDFIEVELSKTNLFFKDFVLLCCEELHIDIDKIKKIRKLPNTIIRNDKDVKRLTDFQEIEVIMKS